MCFPVYILVSRKTKLDPSVQAWKFSPWCLLHKSFFILLWPLLFSIYYDDIYQHNITYIKKLFCCSTTTISNHQQQYQQRQRKKCLKVFALFWRNDQLCTDSDFRTAIYHCVWADDVTMFCHHWFGKKKIQGKSNR